MKSIRNHYKKLGYKGKYLDIRLKEFRKRVIINLITIFFCILSVFLFIYIYLFSAYDYLIIDKIFIEPYMKSISYIYESDDIVIKISELCSNFNEEEDKLICVNNFVDEFFDYTKHENETKLFRTPEEIINEGGCCRDYSLFYSSVVELMGFKNEFIFEPEHVYNKVCGKEDCWEIDQIIINKIE